MWKSSIFNCWEMGKVSHPLGKDTPLSTLHFLSPILGVILSMDGAEYRTFASEYVGFSELKRARMVISISSNSFSKMSERRTGFLSVWGGTIWTLGHSYTKLPAFPSSRSFSKEPALLPDIKGGIGCLNLLSSQKPGDFPRTWAVTSVLGVYTSSLELTQSFKFGVQIFGISVVGVEGDRAWLSACLGEPDLGNPNLKHLGNIWHDCNIYLHLVLEKRVNNPPIEYGMITISLLSN